MDGGSLPHPKQSYSTKNPDQMEPLQPISITFSEKISH
jgi:hypothetical protein